MNCGICHAHLREKNKCPGCRFLESEMPISIERCKIRNCEQIKKSKVNFCFECAEFPCKNLKYLDKRYRTKYNMSEIGNLKNIRKNGIRKFIESEKIKWSCSKCGGTINVHKKVCSVCGLKMCFEKWNSPLTPLSFFKTEKIKFIINEESLSDNWERKIFFELKPRCALLLLVVGAYNSGYEVRPSARGSPKLLPLVATSHIRKR